MRKELRVLTNAPLEGSAKFSLVEVEYYTAWSIASTSTINNTTRRIPEVHNYMPDKS